MAMNIERIEGDTLHPLYVQYSGQYRPQTAHVEIDPEDMTISAAADSEIGNSVSALVWHGRVQSYTVDNRLTAVEVNDLMAEIQPLAERLAAGYNCEWNGSNWVGSLTDDALEADGEITEICYHTQTSSGGVWEPGDWLAGCIHGRNTARIQIDAGSRNTCVITPKTQDWRLERIAIALETVAAWDEITVLGLREYLYYLRSEARASI